MIWRISSLSLVLLLAACSGSSSGDNTASTFDVPTPTNSQAVTPTTNTTTVVSTTTTSTSTAAAAVDPIPTLDQALALVRAGQASQLIGQGFGPVLGNELAEAGYEPEAFQLLAPPDNPVTDKNTYPTTLKGSIAVSDIDETPSVKRQTMQIGGNSVPFTAQAGHLVVYNPYDTGNTDPEAAVFYTAYTREGLPGQTRPITFIWDGGPGSSMIELNLASWGPWRMRTDEPTIPSQNYYKLPSSLPFEENALTLLDRSDLVFIDPPGTGYSTATGKYQNATFWGTDNDAIVFANFIAGYVTRHNRQSSPKYLYGESYGGIRTPIVADLMVSRGSSQFAPDPSGKPATVLSGIVLNSPILNYLTNCDMAGAVYNSTVATGPFPGSGCSAFLPNYAMAADFLALTDARGNSTQPDFLQSMREFATAQYIPTLAAHSTTIAAGETVSDWTTFAKTDDGKAFTQSLVDKTALAANYWAATPNLLPETFQNSLYKNRKLGRFDARMVLPADSKYSPDDYPNLAIMNEAKTFFPNNLNYTATEVYPGGNDDIINYWYWPHRGSSGQFSPSSIVDLTEALAFAPALKLLVVHGYEDLATPGVQTEQDLQAANLAARVPVKWFEGGHMTYLTEASRGPIKDELDRFYDDPDYSVPPAAAAMN